MCTLIGSGCEVTVKKEDAITQYRWMRVERETGKLQALYSHRTYDFSDDAPRAPRFFEYKVGRTSTARDEEWRPQPSGPIKLTRLNKTGFYSYHTYRFALNQKPETIGKGTLHIVLARVKVWGNCVLYSNGMRSSKLHVEALVCGTRPKTLKRRK